MDDLFTAVGELLARNSLADDIDAGLVTRTLVERGYRTLDDVPTSTFFRILQECMM